ncbi:MAG: LamG-like jellyroll fold domain-containing protein, partial [Patescibacteria group bacterium]
YVYTETGEDNGSYTLFFCLGGTNSGISSGLAVASPVGVEYGSFENLKVGLIGHWALDNIDGVVDKSTSGNNGTGVGGVTIGGATDRHGQANGATSFDGVNDYIDCGAFTQIDGIQKMTMVYWGKKSATNKLLPIGKRSDSSANASAIALNVWNDGLIYWNVSEFPVVRAGRCSFNDTNWHLFTMVFDGSLSGNENRLKGYIDGIQQSLFFTGTIPTSLTSIAGNMYIGASSQSIATYYGSGSISDVRVYNRALSEEEIQQLYLLEN